MKRAAIAFRRDSRRDVWRRSALHPEAARPDLVAPRSSPTQRFAKEVRSQSAGCTPSGREARANRLTYGFFSDRPRPNRSEANLRRRDESLFAFVLQ